MPMTPGRRAGSAAQAVIRVGRCQLRVSVMIGRLLACHRDPVLRRTRLKIMLVMEVSAHEAAEMAIFWAYRWRYPSEGTLLAATALEQGHDADAQ